MIILFSKCIDDSNDDCLRFLGQLQRKKVVGQFFVSRKKKNEVSTSVYNDYDGKVKL